MDRFKVLDHPCGEHGPYKFYRAVQVHAKNQKSVRHVVALGQFLPVRYVLKGPVCLAEVQLLFSDKNHEGRFFGVVKIYLQPQYVDEDWKPAKFDENEVMLLNKRLTIDFSRFIRWLEPSDSWTSGYLAPHCDKENVSQTLVTSHAHSQQVDLNVPHVIRHGDQSLNMTRIATISQQCNVSGSGVVVLTEPEFIRYRSVVRRLGLTPGGSVPKHLNSERLVSMGLFVPTRPGIRVVFCKAGADCSALDMHPDCDDEYRPHFKGRKRLRKQSEVTTPSTPTTPTDSPFKKRASTSLTEEPVRESSTEESEPESPAAGTVPTGPVASPLTDVFGQPALPACRNAEDRRVTHELLAFMNERGTPIRRFPKLNHELLDLAKLYRFVKLRGGYEQVTKSRSWSHVFSMLCKAPNTAAATIIRRHYEKFILAFEKHKDSESGKQEPSNQIKIEPEVKTPKPSVSDGATLGSLLAATNDLPKNTIKFLPDCKLPDAKRTNDTVKEECDVKKPRLNEPVSSRRTSAANPFSSTTFLQSTCSTTSSSAGLPLSGLNAALDASRLYSPASLNLLRMNPALWHLQLQQQQLAAAMASALQTSRATKTTSNSRLSSAHSHTAHTSTTPATALSASTTQSSSQTNRQPPPAHKSHNVCKTSTSPAAVRPAVTATPVVSGAPLDLSKRPINSATAVASEKTVKSAAPALSHSIERLTSKSATKPEPSKAADIQQKDRNSCVTSSTPSVTSPSSSTAAAWRQLMSLGAAGMGSMPGYPLAGLGAMGLGGMGGLGAAGLGLTGGLGNLAGGLGALYPGMMNPMMFNPLLGSSLPATAGSALSQQAAAAAAYFPALSPYAAAGIVPGLIPPSASSNSKSDMPRSKPT